MTPAADPPGPRQRQQRDGAELPSPSASRSLPDLILLDEAARPIGTVSAATLPGARLSAFYAYWLCGVRLGALPDVSAIDPLLMPPEILPFMVIYAIEPGGGFRMRLIGTAVVDRSGEDLTGRLIQPFGVMATLHGRLTWCLQHQRPYIAHGQVPAAERNFIQFTAIAAPFVDRSGKIQRIASVLQFSAPG